MSSADRGTVLQRLDRLFTEGTLAGLGDGELLERFRTRRDEAAFEALVELHGPMVLGLCRRFLRDPRDIEDAFQATFLVLVQKAPSIRDGGLLSSWLYGVALRVATRARANLPAPAGSRAGARQGRRSSRARHRGHARTGPAVRSGIEPAPGEVSCSAGVVLSARANSRPGRQRALLSGRDRPQPHGPRTRLAQTAANQPWICTERRVARPGVGRAIASSHDSGARAARCRDGPRGLRNRLDACHENRRGPGARIGSYPRSRYIHEICTVEVDRSGPAGDRSLSRRGRRRCRHVGPELGHREEISSRGRFERGTPAGRLDWNGPHEHSHRNLGTIKNDRRPPAHS